VFRFVTSFNALPARNLWRFFRCEVFFLGTAHRIDSQSSERMEGRLKCIARGMANGSWTMVDLVSHGLRTAARDRKGIVENRMASENIEGINA